MVLVSGLSGSESLFVQVVIVLREGRSWSRCWCCVMKLISFEIDRGQGCAGINLLNIILPVSRLVVPNETSFVSCAGFVIIFYYFVIGCRNKLLPPN